ncbi:hypothetical protein [Acinetobacter haemolyticus]|uniref:hypothetical protein n=1 Tax=Acinetobacter haemolyticus TaxID=29430 RepID=UPI003AF88F31
MLKIRQNNFKLIIIFFFSTIFFLGGCIHFSQSEMQPAHIEGIFWQPDLATTPPKGNWNLLGVSTFVPQWSIVQSKSWFDHDTGFVKWDKNINLQQLNQNAWASEIILGLAGEYDEKLARSQVMLLAQNSKQLIAHTQSIPLKGYYFPVEADPTWLGVGILGQALTQLPKPLWVSIYSADEMPIHYDVWLKSWLPEQTNVFFQDGVGVGTRSPEQARIILDELQHEFGKDKITIVLEAFRATKNGHFRAAYPWEIIEQLKAYEGQKVYIFDGPHYMSRINVYMIALWYKLKYRS